MYIFEVSTFTKILENETMKFDTSFKVTKSPTDELDKRTLQRLEEDRTVWGLGCIVGQ